MSPYEITLIIIGIVCIVVSCFLVEQKKEEIVETELGNMSERLLYSQLSDANETISTHVTQLKENVFVQTQEELNRLSNEKIMAVHEYSEQVLGDIKKSHDEVMFLYQMLTDKEEELKTSLHEMQQTKREIEQFFAMVGEDAAGKQAKSNSSSVMKKASSSQQMHQISKPKKQQESTDKDLENHYSKTLQEIETLEFSSHIDEILALFEQGYSVVDISKRLGLGQGEVNLVLNYNKRK